MVSHLYIHIGSGVANTCGTCLPSYIGLSFGDGGIVDAEGNSNSPCFLATLVENDLSQAVDTPSRRLSSRQLSVISIKAAAKSCPQMCSGHGTCTSISASTGLVKNSSSLSSVCGLTDSTCSVICTCDFGFAGIYCDSTTYVFDIMKSYISSLIISAQELMYIDDFDKSVGSWLSILVTISEHTDMLSTSSRRQLLAICSSIIANLLKSDISAVSLVNVRNHLLDIISNVASSQAYYLTQPSNTNDDYNGILSLLISTIEAYHTLVHSGNLTYTFRKTYETVEPCDLNHFVSYK